MEEPGTLHFCGRRASVDESTSGTRQRAVAGSAEPIQQNKSKKENVAKAEESLQLHKKSLQAALAGFVSKIAIGPALSRSRS